MPDLKDLRYRAEYMALRFIEATLRTVPLDFGVNVSAKAWRLFARFDHRHQRARIPGRHHPGRAAVGDRIDRKTHT